MQTVQKETFQEIASHPSCEKPFQRLNSNAQECPRIMQKESRQWGKWLRRGGKMCVISNKNVYDREHDRDDRTATTLCSNHHILAPCLNHLPHSLDSFCIVLGHSQALLFNLWNNFSKFGWLAISWSVFFCTVCIPTPLPHHPCYPLQFWGFIALL